MKINSKKGKITFLCVLIAAVMLSIFSAVIATDNTSTQYWKAVPMDVDSYRSDLNNLKAPIYDESADYIFAGWFTDKECTEPLAQSTQTGSAYAKFVPAKILGIKAQVNVEIGTTDNDTTNDETGAIRFVTSVDSLDYREIGFVFERGKGEEIKSSGSVYTRLFATVGETDGTGTKDLEYIPSKEFDASSQYFKSWTYTSVPASAYNTEITVTPFWITLDGTTVKAETGMKTVNEGRQWKYIFVDDTGDDEKGTGTRGCPYQTLNGALNHIQKYGKSEGGQIWIKDTLKTAADFKWEEHGVDVTIMGDSKDPEETANDSKLDFSDTTYLEMGDAATFTDMDLVFPADVVDSSTDEITDPGTVYANGHRLEISDGLGEITNTPKIFGGSTDAAVESTDVTLLKGSYANIYGGGETQAVNGDTNVYIGGEVNSASSSAFAGCWNATVSGDTHITVGGDAKVQYVRGGGNSTNQKVEGTCYVSIQDNAVIEGVNGGGANGSTNNTYVVVTGGTIEQVFGGQTTNGGTVNNTNVHILGGTITRRVYGGSYNEYATDITDLGNFGWSDTVHFVAGYSSVTIGKDANISERTDSSGDTSISAVSRAGENYSTEVGVMILNYGTDAEEVGFSSTMESISDASYTHFLVNVVEEGASGTVTSESGVLRIKPDTVGAYATVTEPDGDTVVIKGEGTYSLSGLTKDTSVQEITVTFSDTVTEEPSGDYVLSYGDNSYSYFSSLTDAMAAVSTPSVNTNGVYEEKTATITIGVENVTVDSTLTLTDGANVIIQNKAGQNLTFTRDANLTEASMFNVAFGSSLSFECNDGTITVDGNNVAGLSMIDNAGTFVLGEGATLQNGTTAVPGDDVTNKNVKTYHGGALYNTGVAYIHGTVQNNSAYYGGAIYIASDGIVELETNNSATISGNTAGYRGGAIFINRGTLNASGYVFTDNSSTSNYGGAIYINAYMSGSNQIKAQANLYNCTFGGTDAGNSATAGGAILVAGSLVADGCTFESNETTSASGGAIEVYEENANFDADITVTNSTFTNNTAKGYSGAIDINGGGNGVDGTDNIQISNCSFKGNSSKSGGTIAIRKSGAQMDVSDLTFEGDASGNVDVIYILQPSAAIAYESVAISGVISKAEIYIAEQPASDLADQTKAPIVINGHLSSESDITVTTKYSYDERMKLVAKSDDTVSDLTFKNATKVLKVTQVSGNYWFIDSTGCLSQVSATINGIEGSYADALAAIANTTSGAVEIQFLRDVEIADTISIPAGADVTITNESGVNVTLTRAGAFDMFNVASGGALSIGSADTAKTITIDGGYGSTYTTEKAPSLIQNAGTLVVQENVMIQNSNTNVTSNPSDEYKGGALYNTGTATLRGNFTGNTGYNGGAIYGKGGTVTIEGGTYSNNMAKSNGGVIAGSSAVVIEEGIFQNNAATATGGVAYLSGTLEINDGTFHNNTAKGGTAGVIYCNNTLNINGGTFYKNTAKTGGGVINVAGTATIKNATMYENSLSGSTNAGGAIYVTGEKTLDLQDCNIYNNASDYVDDTNPGSDVSLGGKTTLNLYNNTNIGVVQLRYQTESIGGTINVKEVYTGEMVLLPFDNVYTIGLQVVTFADETSSSAENIVVRKYTSASEYDDATYCVDTDGLLQYKNAEAKVGTITYLTLAEAVTAAGSGDTVYVLKDVELGETIAIGDAENTKEITITNAIGKDVTITRTLGYTMFTVASNSSLNISCSSDGTITLDGNRDADVVGPTLILNAGTFTLGEGVTLQKAETNAGTNSSDESGAALYNTGTAYIHGNIMNNHAYAGGAIYSDGGSVELSSSTDALISNNTTAKVGGAIYLGNSAELNAEGYVFSDNVAGTNGGVIGINSAAANFDDCTFEGNQTGTGTNIHGGVAYVNGTFNVDNCTFSNNIADDNGGVLRIYTSSSSTSAANVSNSTFSGNIATKGNALSVSGSTQVNVSACTFTESSDGEKQVIYLENSTPQLNISGKIVGGTIANLYSEQLVINGEVSKESDITITPNSYAEGAQILTANDTVSAEELAKTANIIGVTPNSVGEWYISHEGILLPATVKAQVGSTYYTDVDIAIEDAIATLADADSTAKVYVLQDETMDESVTVSMGTLVVTNAPSKDVELARTIEESLFVVESGATLQIGANTSGSMIVDGGYVSTDTSTTIVPSLIQNAGTLVVNENVTIQNANTKATSDPGTAKNAYKAGALFNTGTAILSGDFTGNTGYNGGAIYGSGGTITIIGGTYSYNTANNNGGVIAGSSSVIIETGTFQNNTATAGGGVFYLGANLEIQGGTFTENKAEGASGGVIYCNKVIKITGGTFYNNSASSYGGVMNVYGSAEISRATMYGNTAGNTNGGSAIYVSSGKTLQLKDCIIYNNETCDIRFGNTAAYNDSSISGISVDDGDDGTTENCYVYYDSTKYYIDSDGSTLVAVE